MSQSFGSMALQEEIEEVKWFCKKRYTNRAYGLLGLLKLEERKKEVS